MGSSYSELSTLSGIIRQRRSVKPALMDPEKPVDAALLDTLLENANWAPTHGLTEPWRFTVFTGSARQKLAGFLQGLYQVLTPAHAFKKEKLEKLGRNPLLAPVVLAICMQRGNNSKIPELEEVEAVACAVQNLHLSASAAGLAGFWSTPPILSSAEMRAFLGLGDKDACLGLFYLGWPKEGEPLPESRRSPMKDKVTWF
ncbi:MAG: nitroreductase family protein [Limisphaerales bacterium]